MLLHLIFDKIIMNKSLILMGLEAGLKIFTRVHGYAVNQYFMCTYFDLPQLNGFEVL